MIIPVNGRILIRLENKETKINKNILISESNKEKTDEGIVIKTDEGNRYPKSGVNIDDRVIFNRYSGYKIKSDNINYILIKEEDILAIIRKDES